LTPRIRCTSTWRRWMARTPRCTSGCRCDACECVAVYSAWSDSFTWLHPPHHTTPLHNRCQVAPQHNGTKTQHSTRRALRNADAQQSCGGAEGVWHAAFS
jgi:hypothetical protein